jgi:serine protease Do
MRPVLRAKAPEGLITSNPATSRKKEALASRKTHMEYLSRLVCKTSATTTLRVAAALIASAALASPTLAAQLFAVTPDSPALLLRSSQGYLGIDMRDIDSDRAAALNLKETSGAEIITVDHDAPAGKVGLRIHDVIQQLNGQPIQGVEQLRRMLRETPAGRSIVLLIIRDGQPQTVNVQLADRAVLEQDAWSQHLTVPDPDSDSNFVLVPPSGHGSHTGNSFFGSLTIGTPSIGVELDPLGTQLADYFGVKDGQGLLVKRVAENSPASTAGLKAGDVITKVNGANMATLNTWIKALHASRGQQVQVTIVRNHKEQTLSMQAGDSKHKGDLEMPLEMHGMDLEDFRPEINLDIAQLDTKLKQIDPAQFADQIRLTVDGIDTQKLTEDARQAADSVDVQKFQKQMKDQQQQMQQQMKDLWLNLDTLHVLDSSHPDMY